MIIWGSKAVEGVVAEGHFYCPACKQTAAYTHKKVDRYFTLYFIPLFSTEELGNFVQCRACGAEFSSEILNISKEELEAMTEPWTCESCFNTNGCGQAECLACGKPRRV